MKYDKCTICNEKLKNNSFKLILDIVKTEC